MGSIRKSAVIALFFIVLVAGLAAVSFNQAKAAFEANVFLNGAILGLLAFGLAYNLFLFVRLRNEAVWFGFFEKTRERGGLGIPEPKLLKPLRSLFQEARPSAFALRATLGGIQNRFDETREINRYISGLAIFLGLLGTFWGLSRTVTSISFVISGIDLRTGNIQEAFDTLRDGLKAPLVGMGTAFSSSMFGLLSSLVVGFIDTQYGKAAQGFFYGVEERTLSDHAGVDAGGTEMTIGNGTYARGLLEQAAESMRYLAKQSQRTEESRGQLAKNLIDMTEKLNLLIDQQTRQLTAIQTLSRHQLDIGQAITRQAETNADIVKYWRGLDTGLAKIIEDVSCGKNQLSREICEEIRTVSRILSALGDGGRS